MKKQYIEPEIELIYFKQNDVLTSSGLPDGNSGWEAEDVPFIVY